MYKNSREDRDESGPSTVHPRNLRNEDRASQATDKSYPHEEMWRRLTGHTWDDKFDSKMKQKIRMNNTTENIFPNDEMATKSFDDDSRSELAAMEHIRQHILGQTGCGVMDHFQHGLDMDAIESASWMKIVIQFLQSKELKRAVQSWMNIPILRRGGAVPASSDASDAESVCSRGLPAPTDGKSTARDTMEDWKDAISRELSRAYCSKKNFRYSWRDAKEDALFRDMQVQVDSQTKRATHSPKEKISNPRDRKASRSCHAIVEPHSRGGTGTGTSTDSRATRHYLPENTSSQRVTLVHPVSITCDWNRNSYPSPPKPSHQNSQPQGSEDIGFQQRSYLEEMEQQVGITNAEMRSRIANHCQGIYLLQGKYLGTTHKRQNEYPSDSLPLSLQDHTLQTANENSYQGDKITTSKSSCAGFLQLSRAEPSGLVSRATSMTSPEFTSANNEMLGRNVDINGSEEIETSLNRPGIGIQDKEVFTSVAGSIPTSESSATRNTQTSAHLIENRRLRHWGPGVSQSVSLTTRPAQTGPIPITQKKALTNAISVQTFLASRDRKSDKQKNPKENCASQTSKPLVLKIPIKSNEYKDTSSRKNGAPTTIQRTIIQTLISKLRKGETGLRSEQISFNTDPKALLQNHSITRKLKVCASNICNTAGSKGNLKTTSSLFRYNTTRNLSPKRTTYTVSVCGRRVPSRSISTESTGFVCTCQKDCSTQHITSHGASRANIRETIKDKKTMRSTSMPRKLHRLRCITPSIPLSHSGTQTYCARGLSSRPLPLYEQRRMLGFLPADSSIEAETIDLIPTKITPQAKDKKCLGDKVINDRNKVPLHTADVNNAERTLHFEGPTKVKNKMPHSTTSVPKNNIVITKHTLSVPLKMSSLVHAQRVQIEVNKNPVTIKEIPSVSQVPLNPVVANRNQLKRKFSPHHSQKSTFSATHNASVSESTKSMPPQSCGRSDLTSRGFAGSEEPMSGVVTGQSSSQISPGTSVQDSSALSTGLSSISHTQSQTPMDSSASMTPMRSVCTSPMRYTLEDKKTTKSPPSPSEALNPATASVCPEKCTKEIKFEHQTTTGKRQIDSKPGKEKMATKCEPPSMCSHSRQLAEHVLSVLQKQREYVESHFNKLAETCETLISEASVKEDSEEQLKKVANICRSLLKVPTQTRSSKPERYDSAESEEEPVCISRRRMRPTMEEREGRLGDELWETTRQKHATSAGCTRNSPETPYLSRVPPPFVCIPPNDGPIPQSLDPSALPSIHSTRFHCPYLSSYSRLDPYDGPHSNVKMMDGDNGAYYDATRNHGWLDEQDFAKRRTPSSWVLDAQTPSANTSKIRIKEEPQGKGSGYGSTGASASQNQSRTPSDIDKGRPTSILKQNKSRTSANASRESSESRGSSRAQSRGPNVAHNRTSSKAANKVSSKPMNKTPSKSTHKVPSKSTNRVPSKTSNKSENKSPSRSTGTAPHSMTNKSPSKAPSVASSVTSSRGSSRAPSKSPSRVSSKASVRASSKASSRAPSTASSRAPSTAAGKASSTAAGKAPSSASSGSRESSRAPSGSRESSRAPSAESKRVAKPQKRSTGDTSLKSKKNIESKRSTSNVNSPKMNSTQKPRVSSQRRNESSNASHKQSRQLRNTAPQKHSRQSSGTASRNRFARHSSGRSTSKTSARSSTRMHKRNESKSTIHDSKRSTRSREYRGSPRQEKTSATKGTPANHPRRERSPSSRKRLLEYASDTSTSTGKGYHSRKGKGVCICKKTPSSSQDSLSQEKCEARCASRGADPMGRRTPCGLKAYQERRGIGPKAEDSTVAGSTGSTTSAAGQFGAESSGNGTRRSGDEGRMSRMSHMSLDDGSRDKSSLDNTRASSKSIWFDARKSGQSQTNGDMNNDNVIMSPRTALLTTYLAHRGFFQSPAVKALLYAAAGGCVNLSEIVGNGGGCVCPTHDWNWPGMDQQQRSPGCCGARGNGCCNCRDTMGNSNFSQGISSHGSMNHPQCKCDATHSESFLPNVAKCQIPMTNPPPDPPMRLVSNLGPMQGPLGRAPFAPPPFRPCCAPPTNMGAVAGPCPCHGHIAMTPHFLPLPDPPYVSDSPPCYCTKSCGNFWNY